MVQNEARRTLAEGDKSEDRRREILRAASNVFRRKGLHATGMRDIASELSMHVGNLYYYFRNKEELLAFCQQDALSGLQAMVEDIGTTQARPDEKLKRLIARHVQLLNEETPGSLAHLEVEALSEQWRPKIQGQRDRYERFVRRLIQEGIRAGVFRPVEPRTATLAILGAVNWTVKWFRPSGRKSARQVGEDFADVLVGGLLPQ